MELKSRRRLPRGRGGHSLGVEARFRERVSKDGLATFPDRFFAGALLRSYLEHDADARDVMIMLGRKMRAGGIAVIKVPNYRSLNRQIMGRSWCGIRLPDQRKLFSPAPL